MSREDGVFGGVSDGGFDIPQPDPNPYTGPYTGPSADDGGDNMPDASS